MSKKEEIWKERDGEKIDGGGGGCGPQKKTIIKFEKLPDTKYWF